MSDTAPTPRHGANGQAPPVSAPATVLPIVKPPAFSLDGFKSGGGKGGGAVDTLQAALPHHRISDTKDFARLHYDNDEDTGYWSSELCFVNIPIKGQKRDLLHLIQRDLIPADVLEQVLFFRLALASKPFDTFFLCQVPSRNLDNIWNQTSLQACELGKSLWVKATSVKEEGKEGYKISTARDHDAFPEPKWPSQSLTELIGVTFGGDRVINYDDHPALHRLLGRKLSAS